jgi:HEAT repeat protein
LVRFADVNDAIEAVPQLSKLGPEAAFAVPSLVKATKSEDLLVRLFAAEALGKIGVWDESVQAAIDQLIETATDLDVREAAQAVKKQQQDKPDQNSPK